MRNIPKSVGKLRLKTHLGVLIIGGSFEKTIGTIMSEGKSGTFPVDNFHVGSRARIGRGCLPPSLSRASNIVNLIGLKSRPTQRFQDCSGRKQFSLLLTVNGYINCPE